jgi:hypothetical protein
MSTNSDYIVMGEDGKEYGPVTSAEVREWVAEGRLEKKSPVRPNRAKDWVFLGDLPEFASLFGPKPPRSKKTLFRVLLLLIILAIVLGAVYFLVVNLKPHP